MPAKGEPTMQSQEKIRRHTALISHMADTLGLDLEEQTMTGHLDPEELADAVLRCTACAEPDTCEQWLAVRQGTVDAPPGYCRNTQLFEDLRNGVRI
jgi:hypothetical protein